MGKGTDRMARALKQFTDVQLKLFKTRYGQQFIDLLELPIKVVFSPFTLAFDVIGSAPRGFGIPKLASDISFTAIFVVATLGTYDIAMELGKKVICQRNCKTCNGWQAMRCTMCTGSGKVHYRVKSFGSGKKATAENIADAIVQNQAELIHLPSAIDLPTPLPSKDCPTCDGTGVMSCPECKNQLQIRISADDIIEPPWKAYNVLKKMDYPYENIVHSMKDPKVAAFWLLTMPQIMGGFTYDDDVKKKIWWAYEESMRYDQLRDIVAKRKPGWENLQNESMRYDQLRDIVAKRKPGWENLQNALITLDPIRARDDPVIVKNVPYYKAKKALEEEVMKLDVPPRPDKWGESELPLSRSSWTERELKDPKKLLEMTTLLNAQREIAYKLLDAQWEEKWRQDKLNAMLEEKVQPYIRSIDKGSLPQSIVIQSQELPNKKKSAQKKWFWFF